MADAPSSSILDQALSTFKSDLHHLQEQKRHHRNPPRRVKARHGGDAARRKNRQGPDSSPRSHPKSGSRPNRGRRTGISGFYVTPGARKADPRKTRYERRVQRKENAEFSRRYDDSEDEERESLRTRRRRELGGANPAASDIVDARPTNLNSQKTKTIGQQIKPNRSGHAHNTNVTVKAQSSRIEPTRNSQLAESKARTLFSMLVRHRSQSQVQEDRKANEDNEDGGFNRFLNDLIPTSKEAETHPHPESSKLGRNALRKISDHQKLYAATKKMEDRVAQLQKQNAWSKTETESAVLRSDLRDVYVDIIMRAPEYGLLKNIVLRIWMTYYRQIHTMKIAYGRGRYDLRPKLISLLDEASSFFKGLVACVCVRFNLYPPGMDVAKENERLQSFLLEQYGELPENDTRNITISRIVAELYIVLGDLERYRAQLKTKPTEHEHVKSGGKRNGNSKRKAVSKEKNRISTPNFARARALYRLAASTCPGYGKAHNQLAMVAQDDELEAIFQYMMSLNALESFPAQENLLAAFEASRKRYESLPRGELTVARGASASVALRRLSVQFARLVGVLYTKIGVENVDDHFQRCVVIFHYCLETGALTDGVLIRIVILSITLAHKGRLPQNVAFYHERDVDGMEDSASGSERKSISSMTLRALDLIFEFLGAAARKCCLNMKALPYLAPLASLSVWLHYNKFVVKSAPKSDRRAFFTRSFARLANALERRKKKKAQINSAAIELVSGYAPLGNLPEFAGNQSSFLQPCDQLEKNSLCEYIWTNYAANNTIVLKDNGKSVSTKNLKRWQSAVSDYVVPWHDVKAGVSSPSLSTTVTLGAFSTEENNFAVVVGVVPDSFQIDTRLPIGWKVPGYGLVCGTGDILSYKQSGPSSYSQPLAQGDQIAVRLTRGSEGTGFIEFFRNGKNLGVAFKEVDVSKSFRVAVSLIQTQTVTLTNAMKNATEKENKSAFTLEWQCTVIAQAAEKILFKDPATGRYLAERQRSTTGDANAKDSKLESQHNISLSMPADGTSRAVEVGEGHALKTDGLNSDLVAMAKARAAQTRAETQNTNHIESVLTAQQELGQGQKYETGAVGAAAAHASRKRLLVLDLPNICLRHGNHKVFSCAGVQLCIDYFFKKGYRKIVAFVPEHLLDYDYVGRHRSLVRLGMESEEKAKTKMPDNVSLLLSLKEEGFVVPTPPQDYDDSYCIEYAHKHGGFVVTNDKYRDCGVEGVTRDWLKGHLMTFAFVNDEFIPNPDFRFK
mmetsp:Transcript_31803/g.77507  ORF Transcript_31803/g.77507 Transcript_31803/m.77507 type:complete len:1248 (-) Transcript_31803:326-4069(-)